MTYNTAAACDVFWLCPGLAERVMMSCKMQAHMLRKSMNPKLRSRSVAIWRVDRRAAILSSFGECLHCFPCLCTVQSSSMLSLLLQGIAIACYCKPHIVRCATTLTICKSFYSTRKKHLLFTQPHNKGKTSTKSTTNTKGKHRQVIMAPACGIDTYSKSVYYIHCGAPRFSNTRIAPLYPAARMTCTPLQAPNFNANQHYV